MKLGMLFIGTVIKTEFDAGIHGEQVLEFQVKNLWETKQAVFKW